MKIKSTKMNEKGLEWDEPKCIRSICELEQFIKEVGFLPLFHNEVQGFSVEDYTVKEHWWTNDPQIDPWLWRIDLARNDEITYGKFFKNKAGFISKKWFPIFANARRNGYDFDSLYEDGLAKQRAKKIMDLFNDQKLISSIEMKERAGFGKGGEKNFNGILTELQMQSYLIVKEFHKKKNKRGEDPNVSKEKMERIMSESTTREYFSTNRKD